MIRKLLPGIMLIIAVLMDITVLPILVDMRYVPLFSLMFTVNYGLLLGRTRGALYGMIGGLLVDILVGYPVGLLSAVYIGSGYLSGLAGRKFQRYILTPVVTPFIAFSFYELVMLCYLFMASDALEGYLFRDGAIRVAISTAVSQLAYLAINRLLRPTWSRYAGR